MAQQTDSFSGNSDSTSGKFINKLKDDGLQRVRASQQTAADQLEGVAEAIDRAKSGLDESQPTLAAYAGQLAGGVSNFATRLREGSLDELASDTQRFARNNPGLFVLGSVALGVVLSRFLKASATQRAAAYEYENQEDQLSSSFDASAEDSGVHGDFDSSGSSDGSDEVEDNESGQSRAGYANATSAATRDALSRRNGGLDA